MRPRFSFYKVFVIVILLGVSLGYIDARVNGQKPENITTWDALAVTTQQAEARTWKDYSWKPQLTLGEKDSTLLHPFTVRLDKGSNVYVLDVGDQSVKKFDPDGRLIQTFGFGRGQGPGEFLFPSDFYITEDGGVWVADVSNGTTTAFDPGGELKDVMRFGSRPLRILQLPGEQRLVMSMGTAELFEIYSGAEKMSSFGRLIENQTENFFALEGWLASEMPERVVYVPVYAGFIASFGVDGSLRYLRQTIDPLPWPSIAMGRDGIRRLKDRSEMAAYSAGVTEGKVYIFKIEREGTRRRSIIDLYEEATGRYLYSVEIPTACRLAYWHGSYVYTISDASVTKWRVDAGQEVRS